MLKHSLICFICGIFLLSTASSLTAYAVPDHVYLFSYTTNKDNNHSGLHFAWSSDSINWISIGNEYSFLRSDYGRWGSEKRMISPYLVMEPNGAWHCVWQLNEREKLFAIASTNDLINWGSQHYELVNRGKNCTNPVLFRDGSSQQYNVVYHDSTGAYFRVTTNDLHSFSKAENVSPNQYPPRNRSVQLNGAVYNGQIHTVNWPVVEKLLKKVEDDKAKEKLYAETTALDSIRFSNLQPVKLDISIDPKQSKQISDLLIGIFFEDINYAADGGLYGELIQNRDFEYDPGDREYRDKNWNSKHSWTIAGNETTFEIDSASPVHENNPHYAVLTTSAPGAILANSGYDSISFKKGEKYNLSLFTKQLGSSISKIEARLVDKKGSVLATSQLSIDAKNWQQQSAALVANADVNNGRLEIKPLSAGRIAIDMVSLFPEKTFKNRKNGMREDLAQTIADIHPRFIRFPGGCLAHGDGLNNIYRWKNSIGPLEARKPQRNIWGYHQSAGLGYFEYFRFCEDINAEPLPVVAAGVPCQNSVCSPTGGGQQGGIPLNEMDAYIQEILDLIEWANGDANSKWGRLRAEAGHPKPFNLKYIGIGNEDLISDVFEERFTMIYNAVKKQHPEITVIGTVGPSSEGADYVEGWKLANKLKVPMVDEHYYRSPGWFIYNQDFYDKYDRSASKVYLGEYAAHAPGATSNLETALAEALYLTAVERNGDVVKMTSYAPLLARKGHTQWNPDLIYFDNLTIRPTIGYYVQKLYGNNSGNEYITAASTVSNKEDAVKKRIGYSVVRDTKSGDLIVKIINLLPVAVHTKANVRQAGFNGGKAIQTVLTGRPMEKDVAPVSKEIKIESELEMEIAPYSFNVIRLLK
ncbi:alpha-L-arabinofuranosidase C-terminal domain-containing protein [Danxiaibacter flavus]|uniref:non-reducing end alpha-L-arabinofuranosidase n=1 Tax=Danxiaibacter flavus TaxID=3049108 RepID=A0ABV3ZIY6_9BACT|nr:alpha-L-arabinofuranosidase C-terminal domain-containing protein [Chitinophagaceae bacterium DXS]